MALIISTTEKAAQEQGFKLIVYGQSGSGKTYLASTLPGKTIILSAEGGLLSLSDFKIDCININNSDELREAYKYLKSPEGDKYQNIVLDSISEIGQQILIEEMNNPKHKGNGQAAYGEMAERVIALCKGFRDMSGKNVVFIAQSERQKDESTGMTLLWPSLPGNKAANRLPYLFDMILLLKIGRDADGNVIRTLQTSGDNQVIAKYRGKAGALSQYEPADLTAIFNKINNATGDNKPKETTK